MGGHAIFESSAQLNFILCERDGRDFTCFGWFLPTNRSGLPPPPRNAVSPNVLRKEQASTSKTAGKWARPRRKRGRCKAPNAPPLSSPIYTMAGGAIRAKKGKAPGPNMPPPSLRLDCPQRRCATLPLPTCQHSALRLPTQKGPWPVSCFIFCSRPSTTASQSPPLWRLRWRSPGPLII